MTIDVCHVITDLNVGGAERALASLLTSRRTSDVRWSVISIMPGGAFAGALANEGIPVHTLDVRRPAQFAFAIPRLARLIREIRPTILQGWMYHGNLTASIGRLLSRQPTALSWNIRQSIPDLRRERPLTRLMIRAHVPLVRGVDAVVYNAELARAQHEALGIGCADTRIIPNGVDAERFRPRNHARADLFRNLPLDEDSVLVGHVGRFHPVKNHRGLIDAAKTVCEQRSDVHFLLAGTEVTAANPEIARLVARHPRIHLLGELAGVQNLLAGIDLFCLCSSAEAMPNVVLEAMACGVPCVSTDVGDCRSVIGDTGIVVPANDTRALVAGLERMLALSPDERHALGVRARSRVLEQGSPEHVASAYRDLYADLAARQRR